MYCYEIFDLAKPRTKMRKQKQKVFKLVMKDN